MTYLALLTGNITHTFVSYLFCFHFFFLHYLLPPVWGVFLVVNLEKDGKGKSSFFVNIQTRQRGSAALPIVSQLTADIPTHNSICAGEWCC